MPDVDELFVWVVQASFLHISYVHFPFSHEYDEDELEELAEDEALLQLEPMHCTLDDSGCIPDEIDCEKVLEASEEEYGDRWIFGCFTWTDPDENQSVVLFVQTSFLHVVVMHFPLAQEVVECEE